MHKRNEINSSVEEILEIYEYKDGDLYWRLPGLGRQRNRPAGGNKGGYLSIQLKKKSYAKHRIIFYIHKGYVPKYVDHKDGNIYNNRIENLREASASQNMQNSRGKQNSTSKYKGVGWASLPCKWQVSVQIEGRPTVVGRFDDEIEAARSYDFHAKKYYGEFARLNFPEERYD